MNKLKTLAIAGGAAVLAGGAWFYSRAEAAEAPAYRFATVERGDLRSTVSATGKLSAVRTVQVGTQVSGQVSQIFVDFNDKVKKGQLLATIDPTLQSQAVQDAQAGLERAQAQLNLAQQEYDRNKQLFDAKIITAAEYGTVEANLTVAKSNVKSANIALSRARQNLSYTNIHSPIDGVIVERNVDVGQTVAASLSAPQLFLIANDLADMQILASVDESDIGRIQQGQPVRFTVQSYPNREFTGRVAQVRLQSTTTDNVVSYTAVVGVQNTTGALLPGMTSTLSFVTGEAENALIVPNAALRYRPAEQPTAAATAATKTAATATTAAPARQQRVRTATLWYLDAQGKLASLSVRPGLTDGSKTVVEGEGLTEGMQVIIGASAAAGTGAGAGAGASSSNPLQPQMRGPGGRF